MVFPHFLSLLIGCAAHGNLAKEINDNQNLDSIFCTFLDKLSGMVITLQLSFKIFDFLLTAGINLGSFISSAKELFLFV